MKNEVKQLAGWIKKEYPELMFYAMDDETMYIPVKHNDFGGLYIVFGKLQDEHNQLIYQGNMVCDVETFGEARVLVSQYLKSINSNE